MTGEIDCISDSLTQIKIVVVFDQIVVCVAALGNVRF